MDNTYSCFLIFIFVALALVLLFRCKLKCGSCKDENYSFLGSALKGGLAKFDHVSNETCLQCMRDFSSISVCAPYCIRGEVI